MSDDHDSLDSVIGRYLAAAEEGRAPEVDEYVAQHPRHREGLLSFFADHRAMHQVVTAASPAAAHDHDASHAGSRYRIVGEIARGGMGAVLRAIDTRFDRPIALKVLREDRDDAMLRRRFLFEAQVTGSLQHPGVPPVHDQGRLPDGRLFLAMKLIEGETLGDLLEKRPAPAHDLPRFLNVFVQVCQTLAFAHARGIVHRDLKPLNVMVGAFGEVQVMDWGMARKLSPPRGTHAVTATHHPTRDSAPSTHGGTEETVTYVTSTDDPNATVVYESPDVEATEDRLTRGGDIMGTLTYMPPEQALGQVEQIDARSDVFGLGAILCHIMTGHPPYRRSDGSPLLEQAQQAQLSKAHERLDACGADAELIALARRCLSPRREDRPPDGSAVARQLTEHLQTVQQRLEAARIEAAAATARSEAERRRRRLGQWLAMVVVLAASGIAGGATWYFQDRAAREAERSSRRLVAEAQIKRDLNEAFTGLRKLDDELKDPEGYRRIAEDPEAWTRSLSTAAAQVKQAQSVMATAGVEVDPKFHERTETLVEALDGSEFQRRCAVDMETLRFRASSGLAGWDGVMKSFAPLAGDFETALRHSGFEAANPQIVAKIKDSPLRYAVIDTIDFWALIEPDAARSQRLLSITRACDPHEWRDQVRNAKAWRNRAMLEKLAESPAVIQQPPGIVQVLAIALKRVEGDPGPLLERAIAVSPRDFGLHFTHAAVAASREEAIGAFRAALAVRPDATTAHDNLGRLLVLDKKRDAGILQFRESLRINPSNPVALNNLGFSLLEKNELDEAEKHARAALGLQPNYPYAHNTLGQILERRGRIPEAIAAYQTALKFAPDYDRPKAHLERLQAAKSKPPEP